MEKASKAMKGLEMNNLKTINSRKGKAGWSKISYVKIPP